MVSGLSAEVGGCLDSVTFHYADGSTTMFGQSGGASVPRVDLDPTAEYVSGLVQYEGCPDYIGGGIEFILKSIATGATTGTVSFAGLYQSSSVQAAFNVVWPCRIVGFETSPGDTNQGTRETVTSIQTDCTSAVAAEVTVQVRHDGESFSFVSCVDGAIVWNDRTYGIYSVPDVLHGAKLYQGPHRLAYNEAIEISMPEGGRAFAAFTAGRDGGMPAGLRDDGWVDVEPQGLYWSGSGGQSGSLIEPLLFKDIAPGETYTSPKNAGSDTVMFVVLDPEANRQFVLGSGSLTRQDARAYCLANGMDLASIHSEAENQLAWDLCSSSGTDRCWIGGEYAGGTSWMWSDGTPWDFNKWLAACGDGGCSWGENYLTLQSGWFSDSAGPYYRPFLCSGTPTESPSLSPRGTDGAASGTFDDNDDSNNKSNNPLVVILCVVIGALLVGIAVIIVVMKRRKSAKPPHGRRGPAMVEAATSPTAPPQLASIKAEALGMMSEEPIAEAIVPHGHVSGAEAAAMAEGEPSPQQSVGWGRRFAAWRAVGEPPPPPEPEFEPEC